jgi:hypothetical protein
MRLVSAVRALLVIFVLFFSSNAVFAQSAPSVSPASIPGLMKIAGIFHPADGQPAGAVETVTLSIYAEPDGGVPLWQETQTIALDAQGRYTVLLGAAHEGGIPAAVFSGGDGQWLGTVFERPGEVEGPRVRLASVPYAFRAQDAETLGGRPAADYALTSTAANHAGHTTAGAAAGGTAASPVTGNVVLPGTINFLAKYANGTDVGPSGVYETGAGTVGIGTTVPKDQLHLAFTNTGGTQTGLAVQNLGSTAGSYSGTLFYDQLGVLGLFQGFNNATHEYRINNVAKSGGGFNGTINFMIGNTSALFVDSRGDVGIGTTTPHDGTATNHVSGRLNIAAFPDDENGLFVRKPTTNPTWEYAIQARSDLGVGGPLIGALAGFAEDIGVDVPQSVGVLAAQENGDSFAMLAYNATGTGDALHASGGQFAGDFFGAVRVVGNLTVTGTVSKGGGSFKIDDPLDPANKYLSHSFVESPDMMNIYNGNVTLDADGVAIVTLPEWFEALNRDFRYQLTALGAPGPNLYIAEEIANRRFKIAGGAAGGRVSWQVTGIRHDAFAEAHRIPIEEDKPAAERGHYLYPELYGQPPDTSIAPRTAVLTKKQ